MPSLSLSNMQTPIGVYWVFYGMLPKRVALLTVKWSQFRLERPHVGNRKAPPKDTNSNYGMIVPLIYANILLDGTAMWPYI